MSSSEKKLGSQLLPFIIALTLLTRLPINRLFPASLTSQPWDERQQRLSLLWYPIVGLLLAVILFAVSQWLPLSSALLNAAVLLLVWVLLTGALHLDGFADSIDAACAAHALTLPGHSPISEREKEAVHKKVLNIFKDPCSGPMAVTALVLLLLLKFVTLLTLLRAGNDALIMALMLALVMSRLSVVVLLLTTPYVGDGMGKAFASDLPKGKMYRLVFVIIVIVLLCLPFWNAVVVLVSLGLLLMFWRDFWLNTIGGVVGDCLGALIELSEVCVLLILCFLSLS